MTTSPVIYCAAPDCGKETTSSLKCPVCLKQGLTSVFCDQSCFKRNWALHKSIHNKPGVERYDPFPEFNYTGKVRAQYPLTPKRIVPDHIAKPDYSANGQPISEHVSDRSGKIPINSEDEIKQIKKAATLAREVLDIAAASIKPGITTDELDEIVHNATIERDSYPSPLNYYNFSKSVCTSVNEVICHGIPDKRPLEDGDIVNLDISLYHNGYHADMNETYYVGEKLSKQAINVVETARECLDLAIKHCKPGVTFRSVGDIIEKHAKQNNCSVVRTYVGHGIGKLFHCAPQVAHYARNKSPGIMKPGMVFTIEPMINAGSYKDISWPDDWTAVTADGSLSAQFEHELLITETGVEVLSARNEKSAGGAVKRI
ncbi:Methionine aminopeptidase 1 [Wickerhamomyces ciferrii]|uniref:Methionine aminopeptidase n=1 Tax=Wickerhamomyces ciferrii (strain ATCC 14091 / BCRC 22168 / CBS 111 / JCM 3599 / NBRC 0793 / NRRL Y-1031 F-60-10) TaxID=1206466 RepID=K0KKJ3_WICCF|nr:Methionine aminopeptidase 1 [Wickerhamomyces ciferrii]CCH41638.1 Methionine aminopeptidase 1 [Wickerhamomyces ciferrii]